MKPEPAHHHGNPVAAAAVVGSCSLTLVLVLRLAGFLPVGDGALREALLAGGFGIAAEPSGTAWWVLLPSALGAYGLAWILFETPGQLRRVLLLVTVVVLAVMAAVVLGLWGIFWSPLSFLGAVAWSGFCAMLWARNHPMPCERVEEVGPRKVISITEKERSSRFGGGRKEAQGE